MLCHDLPLKEDWGAEIDKPEIPLDQTTTSHTQVHPSQEQTHYRLLKSRETRRRGSYCSALFCPTFVPPRDSHLERIQKLFNLFILSVVVLLQSTELSFHSVSLLFLSLYCLKGEENCRHISEMETCWVFIWKHLLMSITIQSQWWGWSKRK